MLIPKPHALMMGPYSPKVLNVELKKPGARQMITMMMTMVIQVIM